MPEIEPTSGFLKPSDFVVNSNFTEFESIPNRGYCLLTRAKRNGRWWMLKGLKEPYRQDSVYRLMLQKEFDIMSQLQHPMIVSVYSLEEVSGLGLCIVMEWIDGITLKEWLQQKEHTQEQHRHVADMMLDALAYVHSRQAQHRDLKPSNILITHNGQYLKLIDFGLSDTDSHAILKADAGTEGYMAPEGSSDIYSLGCILREMELGWLSRRVVRRCLAPLHRRYKDVASIQRDLHRCWLWPKRILLIVGISVLVMLYGLWSHSYNLQELQTLSDSLEVYKKESIEKMTDEQAKTDTLQTQLNILNQQREYEQAVLQQKQGRIMAAKKQIDRQVQAYGIEQMFDTVSCRRNVTIPVIRIADELLRDAKDDEVKEYIQERYRKPWIKRMNELPFD
ncbi:MAG: serine/threonine protein kinase [Prevotella sp.]|nr:serine/threonine protein kinase [Prevotella sp.]